MEGTLEQARTQLEQALTQAGVSDEVSSALSAYVDLKVKTDFAVTEILGDEVQSRYAQRDPAEALSTAQVATLWEGPTKRCALASRRASFSRCFDPGVSGGREYPAFQLWDAIYGEPLKKILQALGRPSGPHVYGFFTSAAVLWRG